VGLIDQIQGQRVYLDANVFIYALEAYASYVDELARMFDAIDSGALTAVTSELTLAEVLDKPLMDRDEALQEAYRNAIQPTAGFSVVPVSRAILIEAATVRAASQSLKLPDAIHVATALAAGCSTFLTNDASLRSVPGLHVPLCSAAIR
jgi:predicted nucleic acid-binding protein